MGETRRDLQWRAAGVGEDTTLAFVESSVTGCEVAKASVTFSPKPSLANDVGASPTRIVRQHED